jgi:ketosteroid isomerase-like protein
MRQAVAETSTPTGAVMDLRTYALVPGSRQAFDRILCEEALPMLRRAGIHVVGYGRSLADSNHYFLARAFASRAEREEQLTAFYGSDEWRQSYEDTVMQLIESYHTVVIPLPPSIAEALDVDAPQAEMAAVGALHRLNDECMRAFVESDASWYDAHVSDDFVCTLADGRHIDKTRFMRLAAEGPGVTGVRYDETDVRLLGDVALVQGSTHCLRNGEPRSTRYTVVWRFRYGHWQAAAVQLTSVAEQG